MNEKHSHLCSITHMIDWNRVISDLKRGGLSLRGLYHETGIPVSTLDSIKHGTEPAHHRGEQLISLWSVSTGPATEAPKRQHSDISDQKLR